MGIDQRMQQWLESSRQKFFESDYKELDKELTPEGGTAFMLPTGPERCCMEP